MDKPFCHSPRNVRHGQGIVESNDPVSEDTWRLSLRSAEVLPTSRAGQFVMLRLPNRTDPLLGRPLALYRAEPHRIEVVYLTVGKMTRRLSEVKPGDPLELWMPLGNGFPENDVQHTIIVAGGIGQTPFLMYCQNRQERISLLYGARTADRIACMDDFRQAGIEPMIATDDGSAGYHGQVTGLLEKVYRSDESTQLLCCGPLPMLRSAFLTAQKLGLPCFVSLETPMACGLGICFGCVVPYRSDADSDWDYRRTCIDGPVFDAYKLRWD
ncbi:MAG: dihydroorotate dehydrogenase electron transfer subunit [Planctomycetaceae bacterium]|jgi:dihydroorotate dehydrogenase electron transfer subunit|nr:dihydroorotate dehydrogenase electron transfer subunit [Planctomycetaceae bacterium]